MIKYDKGFVYLVVVLVIITTFLLGGGVIYYYTKVIPNTQTRQDQNQQETTDISKRIYNSCIEYSNPKYVDTNIIYCSCISEQIGNNTNISDQLKFNLAKKFTVNINEATGIPKGGALTGEGIVLGYAYVFCLNKIVPESSLNPKVPITSPISSPIDPSHLAL